jgi:hypothetical protein
MIAKFWYRPKIFLINSDISIYWWLINFELALLFSSVQFSSLHFTWPLRTLYLSRNKVFYSYYSNTPSSKNLRVWIWGFCQTFEMFFEGHLKMNPQTCAAIKTHTSRAILEFLVNIFNRHLNFKSCQLIYFITQIVSKSLIA